MKWWILHIISVNCVWLYLFGVFTVRPVGSCGMELRNLIQIKYTKYTGGQVNRNGITTTNTKCMYVNSITRVGHAQLDNNQNIDIQNKVY